MKKRNSTKQALFTSVLALVLCLSMLVGTTFAWFTDEVVSGKNTIAAGNLDVVLEYWDKTQEKYVEVDGNTKLFDDAALWEPGHTEVAYLKVSNAGTLALKYQLGVNVYSETLGKTKDSADIKLSDYLVMGTADKQVESNADLYTRTEARAAAGTAMGLQTYTGDEKALEAKNAAGDNDYYDYVALIVYMPESVDNRANHDGTNIPRIELGVKLSAIQKDYEADSFGPDYDEGLKPVYTYVSDFAGLRKALEAGKNVALQNDILVQSAADFMYTSGNGALIYVKEKDLTIDLNGHDIIAGEDALMAGKDYANAVILVNKSTLNIVGEGSVIAQNKSIPVYGLNYSTINIYGGTYKTNASERNESAVYVNNPEVMIHVYSGNFEDAAYAFNVHDNKCGNTPVITLHEGVSYKQFLKNGTTDVIAADLKAGRIVLAEGMYLRSYEKNGEIWYEVAKKQEGTAYVSDWTGLKAGKGADGEHVLLNDITTDNALFMGNGTDNTVDLNGKTITADNKNQYSFVAQQGGVLRLTGDGTANVGKGFYTNKNEAELIVDGGTYNMTATGTLNGIAHHSVAQNNSKIVINGGTFTSNVDNAVLFFATSNARIEINGGFFENTVDKTPDLLGVGANKDNTNRIIITGGTFVNYNPLEDRMCYTGAWPEAGEASFGGPWILIPGGYTVVAETQANGDVWYSVVAE